uniref:Uncharacterized protein n=2 Tax=Haptolina ericina TaxID=156174 RepID=A0A7S3FJ06_9EUKA
MTSSLVIGEMCARATLGTNAVLQQMLKSRVRHRAAKANATPVSRRALATALIITILVQRGGGGGEGTRRVWTRAVLSMVGVEVTVMPSAADAALFEDRAVPSEDATALFDVTSCVPTETTMFTLAAVTVTVMAQGSTEVMRAMLTFKVSTSDAA